MENDTGVCFWFISLLVICVVKLSFSVTDPNDFEVLSDFRRGLENPELLKWPEKGDDPCGPPSWPHLFCSGNRITQIQVQTLGLKGRLPQNFNRLSKLYNVGLQNNGFYGKLPTLKGLSELEYAFLNDNQFDAIPDDFFVGLTNLRTIALDHNPLNASTGWSIPNELQNSGQLMEISFVECNLVGQVPDFLGTLPSLQLLELSFNNLSGVIPESFSQSLLQKLWLNNQNGGGMSGSINVVTTMSSVSQLWLHGNQFSGTIPETIGNLTTLRDLNLNGNRLVGLIPESLVNMELDELDLNNNLFMGPMPKFKSRNVTCAANPFCQTKPGLNCAPEVASLIDFLGALDYPANLASEWSGNDPCSGPWLGLSCDAQSKVSIINLPSRRLNGTFSPSVSKLNSLVEIRLEKNNLTGAVPGSISNLRSLRLIDLSENNFQPPLPRLPGIVRLITDGNPLLVTNQSSSPSPASSQEPSNKTSPGAPASVFPRSPPSPLADAPPGSTLPKQIQSITQKSKPFKAVIIIVVIAAFTTVVLFVYYRKKMICTSEAPPSVVIHPRDPSDPHKKVKVAVSSSNAGSLSTRTGASSWSGNSSLVENSHMIDVGNHVISVQVLRKVTKNFATENELGRGGFGVVYRGELEDGTNIAVKRMETGVITSKGLEEFEAEIAVLSKVRHRHLVSLLGYSIEGSERLLVYEYLPQGALSKHLFHWKSLNLEPLSWTRRLIIALDVARGVEYLHCLARQSFIHRDLKSSNILLGDDYRAKVSDFGLVKLAPDREKSVATRLAGTFGYLAPEYAVMGKITTKADVFSFGVVLMELLTGMTALDETRSEEKRYLAEWFSRIKSSQETLMAALDPVINANEVTLESISTVADLAGHCTARDPLYRPDMGHAVNVLGSLVEKWQPLRGESEYVSGIDFGLALPQMLKVWKDAECENRSSGSLNDSKTSIPPRPAGFGESFTSADAR